MLIKSNSLNFLAITMSFNDPIFISIVAGAAALLLFIIILIAVLVSRKKRSKKVKEKVVKVKEEKKTKNVLPSSESVLLEESSASTFVDPAEVLEEVYERVDAPIHNDNSESTVSGTYESNLLDDEDTISNDETSLNSKYELYKEEGYDRYFYRLKSEYGKVILVSEPFSTYNESLESLKLLRKNVIENNIKTDIKNGSYKFVVYSDKQNSKKIYSSVEYNTEEMLNESLVEFAQSAITKKAINIKTQIKVLDESKVQSLSVDVKNEDATIYVSNNDSEYSWELKTSDNETVYSVSSLLSKQAVDLSIKSVKDNIKNGKCYVVESNNNFCFKVYNKACNVITSKVFDTQKEAAETLAKLLAYIETAKVVEL